MKIYLVESERNKELYTYLDRNYTLVSEADLEQAQVVIVNKVYNIKMALEIVDFALNKRKRSYMHKK